MKKFINSLSNSKKGFTLLETLIAMGISAIVITSALGVIGTVYFNQKKVILSQDFYAESRYLMERMAQTMRNNTIDYDEFFLQVGPLPTECPYFNNDSINKKNPDTKEDVTYPGVFYRTIGGSNRNLGGKITVSGTSESETDPCTKAWHDNDIKTLYLINGARNLKTTIKFDETGNSIKVTRRIGADTDENGKSDFWSDDSKWVGDECKIEKDGSLINALPQTEELCEQAHAETQISPKIINVTNLEFTPGPNRDPFLAFRVDEAQVHPYIFINLNLQLKESREFSVAPQIQFQSMISSRVFGNTR